MKTRPSVLWRLAALFALCLGALQLTFALRIGAMGLIDPGSTTFERSEAWRLLTQTGQLPWRQETVAYTRISEQLKRAVIASEDAAFTDHAGIDWDSIERAWERNQQVEARSERVNAAPAKAARPSRNSWRRTCSSRVSARPCARDRSSS